MEGQMKSFILSSLILSSVAIASDLPSWVMKGPMSDSSYHYVVCSHDGIDPEEARQIAESKCLASAAKLGGVNVKVTQKTVQSLTGADSSEVAEIQPLETKIKCEWTDRFLEKIKDGFRVWLRCKVTKSSMGFSIPPSEITTAADYKMNRNVEATLILTILPRADRIIVVGLSGERVIEPTSNVVSIKVSNLDQKIMVSRSGYKVTSVEIPKDFSRGSNIHRDVVLERN